MEAIARPYRKVSEPTNISRAPRGRTLLDALYPGAVLRCPPATFLLSRWDDRRPYWDVFISLERPNILLSWFSVPQSSCYAAGPNSCFAGANFCPQGAISLIRPRMRYPAIVRPENY